MFQSLTDIVGLWPTDYVICHSHLHFVSRRLHVLASAAVSTENTLIITRRYSDFCTYMNLL
jgi:hypothetical protein